VRARLKSWPYDGSGTVSVAGGARRRDGKVEPVRFVANHNTIDTLILSVVLTNPSGDWALHESDTLIADSSGYKAGGISSTIDGAQASIYIGITTKKRKYYALTGAAQSLTFSCPLTVPSYGVMPAGALVLESFGNRIDDYVFNVPNMALTVADIPAHITTSFILPRH
jgi:hypothetical protein